MSTKRQDVQQYHKPARNIIVTGITRSGTTLFTKLLNDIPNVVCFNEIGYFYDIRHIPLSFAMMRWRLVTGKTVPNVYDVDGNNTTDPTKKNDTRR